MIDGALLARRVREGDTDAFDDMNEVLLTILASASAPFVDPCLLVESFAGGSSSRLLTIGHIEETYGDRLAATSELMTHGSSRVTVTLVLSPALLPEALGV